MCGLYFFPVASVGNLSLLPFFALFLKTGVGTSVDANVTRVIKNEFDISSSQMATLYGEISLTLDGSHF